jgi:membrane protein implicated in regulation of membrane protease activity
VSIWFAIAALLSMFAAMAGLGFVWQLLIFVVSSIILLIATKALVKKMRENQTDPNKEYDIGKNARVIEEICNETSSGRVKLDGVDWAARSEDGMNISVGEIVTVKKVDGAKLIVSR